MRRWSVWLLVFLLLCQAAPGLCQDTGGFVVEDNEELVAPDLRRQAQALLRRMTTEEKIYQLFFVTLEDLTGEDRSTTLTGVNPLAQYPVGGVMLFGQNIVSEQQVKNLTESLQFQASRAGVYPLFIGVDEEGGTVSRVANKLGYIVVPSPEKVGASGNERLAQYVGACIAGYLSPLGVNLTFAPSADTVIDKEGVVGVQTYGTNAAFVSRMASAMAEGLLSGGVVPCWTHFPGHGIKTGNTSGDLSVKRTLEEMRAVEFVPYRDAIANDAEMILVSHAIVRSVGDDMPASTSYMVIQGILRGELGYDGVVITDSLRMSAVTSSYKTGQESVAALKAGADLLLLPPDFHAAVKAIQQALAKGELTMARIDESIERILALKIRMGWIQ